MNYYNTAIYKNQVIDFFRGNGEYFEADRDREGVHDFSFTSYQIMGYGMDYGEKILYKRLDEDLIKYVQIPDFTYRDLMNILGIIWVYQLFRKEDKVLKHDWEMSSELSKGILEKINFFQKTESDISHMTRILNSLEVRFNYRFYRD